MSVSGQNSKSDSEKIDLLIYVLGKEFKQIMLQIENRPSTYLEALTEFENLFIPHCNIIFERFKFNTRVQMQGEFIENYIKKD